MASFRTRPAILVTLLILGSVGYPAPKSAAQTPPQNAKPIVVMLGKSHGKLTYVVDSKSVADPLRALGDLVEKRGEEWPAIIYFSHDVTFREEQDLELIASKAGFRKVRAFRYDPDKKIAEELKWGPIIHPFPAPAAN